MKKIISKYKERITFIMLMIGILTGALAPLQKSKAQNIIPQPMLCGGYKIDAASLKKAREFATNNNSNRTQTPIPYLVRIYFHILRESNGANPCATEVQILNEFNTLSADYAQDNICFLNMGWDYVDNSQLDTNYNVNTDSPTLFSPYETPYCINVFYMQKIKGTNASSGGGIGGYTFLIPGKLCLVASGNIGAGQTTSHEVGHCLGMWHTFDSFAGYENINGSNSTTTGDFTSDTPSDPYSHKNDPAPSCFSYSPCLYTGNCTDPNGQSNYTPPYTNLMSYWWNFGCYSNLGLTPGQYGWVNYYLGSNTVLQGCESAPNNYTQGPVTVSSGYHMASAIGTLNTNFSVNFTGTAIATLGGGAVLLEPGFHAYPSAGGRVLIRGSSCNFIPRYEGVPDAEVINPNETVSLTCFPNPATGYVKVQYQLPGDGETSITLLDITGRAVKEILSRTSLPGGHHENKVDLSIMNNGIYFVKMIYNGKTSAVRLVVTK